MSNPKREEWGGRLAIIIAAIAMAVGTGNIWRFPRVAAEHGGGAFLIAVTVGLAVWAVPLLMAEFLMGTRSRLGNVGAFRDFMGRAFTWAGIFMVIVTAGIMFYYAVVVGWSIRYFAVAAGGGLTPPEDAAAGEGAGWGRALWERFIDSPVETVSFHALAVIIATAVVYRGIRGGLERVLKIALPALLVILIILVGRTVTLEGAEEGLRHLFVPEWGKLGNAQLWLEALTQVAWSTGAGWGMMMVYAVYARQREDIAVNSGIIAVSDVLVGFLAAAVILGTVFATAALAEAGAAAGLGAVDPDEVIDAGNVGLTFIYMVELLHTMPASQVFAPLFFLALALAGVSSLIAMFELGTTNLINLGLTRRRAALLVGAAVFVLGLPSAISIEIFENQDWVWGVGLLASGLLTALAMMKYGLERARAEIDEASDVRVGRWWPLCIVLVPAVFVAIFGWWMYQAIVEFHPETWWNPLETFSAATIAVQWGIALIVALALGRALARRVSAGPMTRRAPEDGAVAEEEGR